MSPILVLWAIAGFTLCGIATIGCGLALAMFPITTAATIGTGATTAAMMRRDFFTTSPDY
jgi:hypothetical protein